MELTLTTKDGFPVAATQGILDESAKEPFREKLHPLVGAKGTRLIVDLAGSPRINSSGIGNLVALTADANTNDSRVVFCNLQPYVSMVIGVTKLDKFFNIAPDLDAAVAWCHQN
jgi:anti-sigma B factor antagonist